ncbi:MAG: copper-binding protein [Sphingomonas sp. 28-66-16]|nr:MAG: copper-binding protein [Sphingomonas sp. 28-66-16]
MTNLLDRRQLIRGAAFAGGSFALSAWMPAWAQTSSSGIAALLPMVSGQDIALTIARQTMRIDGRLSHAIGINGTVPGPLIRLREGQNVRLTVNNDLDEDSSIHWHGLLVPPQFDGVPGISFPGIKPRSRYLYEFPIKQSGTYWYHSHSGMQEQLGLYGPIVIDPAGDDPVASDREHVIVLSDHSQMSPEAIFRKMKQMPGYFNYQKQTLGGLLAGKNQSLEQRAMWGGMRMDPTDIADVNGSTYTFLVNGHGPEDNWTALFSPGECVRLRVINASSMTTFNVRIPGLKLTIVQADGQNVRPVMVDEFQIGVAETYDVVVQPSDDTAYTLVGESVDRSGMARATLAPRAGMAAAVPALRKRPLASMKDMGMGDVGAMDMAGSGDPNGAAVDHAAMGHDMGGMAPGSKMAGIAPASAAIPGMSGGDTMQNMSMTGMDMKMRDFSNAPTIAKNPGVQTVSMNPVDRTGEPGQGLENVGHRVLVYRDLMALDRNPDVRAPSRSLDIHLTGNMERFMWSFDGVKMSDATEPFAFTEGERVRVTLINDTMMAHPIHLHGHFFELVTGHGNHAPRKHTVIVQPGGKVSWDLTADAVGDWAFHCHMLYHMMAGMMRTVSVRPRGEAA